MAITKPSDSRLLPDTGRYDELTGLRAVAALAVVLTHAAYWTGHYGPERWGLLWARFDFGVALFFVLSGFLLFRKWVSASHSGVEAPSTSRYLRHRALRILPAYWLTVIAAFLLVSAQQGTGWRALVRSLTLTQVYGDVDQHRGLTQMWSLTTEAAFYLFLPLFAWVVVVMLGRRGWKPRVMMVAILALCLFSVVWHTLTRQLWVLPGNAIYWIPGYLTWFAGGMLLAVLAVEREARPEHPRTAVVYLTESPLSVWATACALMVIASTPVAGEATLVPLPLFEALAKHVLYAAAATLFVAPLVLGGIGSTVTRWLLAPPVQWLGGISYELFLVHLIALETAMFLMGYRVFTGSVGYVLLLTLLISIPAAWTLKNLVDRLLGLLPRRLTA